MTGEGSQLNRGFGILIKGCELRRRCERIFQELELKGTDYKFKSKRSFSGKFQKRTFSFKFCFSVKDLITQKNGKILIPKHLFL